MQRLVKKELHLHAVVQPFVGNYRGKGCITRSAFADISRKKIDFIYVACGDPHKNHRMLVKAWEILASEGTKPSLCLTLETNKYRKLCEWIEDRKNASRLKITNAGELPLQEIQNLYTQSRALIYPSILETVGLPLVEAKAAGIPIIAAELDYVRDIVNPEQTFNPYSALSIARAVKRFLNVKEQGPNFLDSKKFLKNILTNL
jgi:glycosyltransferase involved in cell wall biosynthesis